jgi:hypothetical protein
MLKVKVPRNRPEGPEGDRGIVLLVLDLGARKGWVVITTLRPLYPGERTGTHCTEGWGAPGPIGTCAKNIAPTGIRSPDRPARSESLYRLSYPQTVYLHTFWSASYDSETLVNRYCLIRKQSYTTAIYCFSKVSFTERHMVRPKTAIIIFGSGS